jgi:hypothetical protein
MKYFTPDLLEQLNSPDPAVANAADAEWDRSLERYEQHLQRLGPQLPESIRTFNDLLLHDARVYTLARRQDQLLMVLHKDIPPRDLVILSYSLAAEPVIRHDALPPEQRSPVMDYLYNEFDLIAGEDGPLYTESILFSNGWELQLRFRDVQVTLAESLLTAQSA